MATDAQLNSPSDIVFDKKGNLYIADFVNQVVRKVDTFGNITTIAGTGSGAGTAGGGSYSGDNSAATSANMNGPYALAVDPSGNLIIADGYNHIVRKVNTTTGVITRFAGGNGVAGYSGDGNAATAITVELNNPVGIAIDKIGNVYIADDHNNVIRKVDTAGIISTVAGNHTAGYMGDGSAATNAELNLPIGVAVDTAGNLFIADEQNNVIRKVDKSGIISTFAGTGTKGYSGDGSPATSATLDSAQRVSFDDSNNSSSTPTTPTVVGNMVTIIDSGITYSDSGSGTAIQCIINKTTVNSYLTLNITGTATFPISVSISNASGPINSLGSYVIVPVDSSAAFLSKNANSFTEIFSGGENYTVDSVAANITQAYGTTVLGTFQMWLNNSMGSKTITGNINCYKATIK